MYHQLEQCRICSCRTLTPFLDLGEQELTGVFPASADRKLTKGPLVLLLCDRCHLVQLSHAYDLDELYGDNYGYRSGLNASMVNHLKRKVASLKRQCPLEDHDMVVDIGSNDGTTLGFYPQKAVNLIGIDPSARKFRHYYRPDIHLIEDFFSAERFFQEFGSRARAKIITSIAMFYDLEDPTDFMNQVARILADDGIWHFEQSYMPEMLRLSAYDTVCHEHLEYYRLHQIKWMTDRTDLKIIDVAFNDVNGGSFAVTVAKRGAPYPEAEEIIHAILSTEANEGLDELPPYEAFRQRVFWHRERLLDELFDIKRHGRSIHGYGASTKGNVILQFCGIDADLLECIAEVNETKFGCVTPGTHIPIVSEEESKRRQPDYYLVLPWHFRNNLIERERHFIQKGGKMVFPLPKVDIVED
jgi:hypothetical protein